VFPVVGVADSEAIAYESPQSAWDALSVQPGVEVQTRNEWRVIIDTKAHVVWTFTNPGTPGHPSVVKRFPKVAADGDTVIIQMYILCGATKVQCDHLRDQFVELSNNVRQSVQLRMQSDVQ
tara:strand:+ start:170 stop:532 length:363 start_codon:yes stop_codon:yes gene_type:complete